MEIRDEEARVLVVASDPLVRAGLSAMLDPGEREAVGSYCVRVLGVASDGVELAAALRTHSPDAVLIDFGGLGSAMLELALDADPPWVALVADLDAGRKALCLGAHGVLGRGCDAGLLRAALHGVIAGIVALDPSLAGALFGAAQQLPAPRVRLTESADSELTAREREVLGLLVEALPNKLIAVRLGISEHTVKFHVNAVMAKLGVTSRTEAVVSAARRGMVLL